MGFARENREASACIRLDGFSLRFTYSSPISFPDPGSQKKPPVNEINEEENAPQQLLLSERDGMEKHDVAVVCSTSSKHWQG